MNEHQRFAGRLFLNLSQELSDGAQVCRSLIRQRSEAAHRVEKAHISLRLLQLREDVKPVLDCVEIQTLANEGKEELRWRQATARGQPSHARSKEALGVLLGEIRDANLSRRCEPRRMEGITAARER